MIFLNYIYPLVATIIIEFIVLRLLKENNKKVLLSSVIINTLTNLPLNLFVPKDMVSIGIAEVAIIAIEALWYWIFVKNIKKAVIYSALCNIISFFIGLLIYIAIDLFTH